MDWQAQSHVHNAYDATIECRDILLGIQSCNEYTLTRTYEHFHRAESL